MFKTLLKNRFVQLGLTLLIGCVIGAIFYPTKTIEEKITREYQEKLHKLEEEKRSSEQRLEEKLDQKEQEFKQYSEESKQKISLLRTEVTQLKAKTKEVWYKVVRPDGTIEEKRYRESEIDKSSKIVTSIRAEFDRKVKSIENRWKTVHERRVVAIKEDFEKKLKVKQEIIDKYEKTKKVEINPKKFGIAMGYMSDESYYSNISYDIFGPVFLNLQIESDIANEHAAGVGIGLRF